MLLINRSGHFFPGHWNAGILSGMESFDELLANSFKQLSFSAEHPLAVNEFRASSVTLRCGVVFVRWRLTKGSAESIPAYHEICGRSGYKDDLSVILASTMGRKSAVSVRWKPKRLY